MRKRRKRPIAQMVLAFVVPVVIAACAGNGGANPANPGPERDDTDVTPYGSSDRRFNWDNSLNRTHSSSLHYNTRMEMDEVTARAIADMDGVDSAWVLLTEKNAYVAVNLDNTAHIRAKADMDDRLKDDIAAKVREMNPKIRNVFVSASPDFVERLRGYGEKADNGEPIRGLILEFNRSVERLFPSRIEPKTNLERKSLR